MPLPKTSVGTDNQIDDLAWAKLRISKIVWNMPIEDALGVLADMAVRLLRRSYDGQTAIHAGRIFCSEVEYALERAQDEKQRDQERDT
jgi:hypothetical protein